jgi:hypothetical protein
MEELLVRVRGRGVGIPGTFAWQPAGPDGMDVWVLSLPRTYFSWVVIKEVRYGI